MLRVVPFQNHLLELNGGTGSPCPITVEFKRLRRSGQLASQTKRSYEAMQGANKRTGNLLKKLKLTANESASDEPTTGEPATDKPPISEPVSEPAPLKSINDSAIIKPGRMEPQDTSMPHVEKTPTKSW